MSVHLAAFGTAFQFFNSNGKPLSLGTLSTFAAGTSTPQTTYSDSGGSVPNANPIQLQADGRVPGEIWLTDGSAYKFALKDSGGVLIATWDNVSGVGDPLSVVQPIILAAFSGSSGSSNVGFLQAGTGAVTRTVQSKLRDVVSVKDFGAVGDGVTDDLGAITAAITAVAVAGGTVYFPAGTYKVTARIPLVSGVFLRGAGMEATKIVNTAGSSPSNIAIDARGVLGSNFAINAPTEGANTVTTTTAGNAGNFTPGALIGVSGDISGQDYVPLFIATVTAVNAGTGLITLAEKLRRADLSKVHVITSQIKNVGVSDLSITSTGDVGIVMKYVRNGYIERVYFASGIGTAGVNCVGSREIRIVGCVSDAGKSPDMHSTWDSVLAYNIVRAGSMTQVGGCDSVALVGNRIYDPPTWGIKLDTQSQRCEVVGNAITNVGSGQVGVFIDGSALVASGGAGGFGGHTVSANSVTGGAVGGNYGVSIGGNSADNAVTGNRLHGLGFGVSTTSAVSTVVSGNRCSSCSTDYASGTGTLADTALTDHFRTGGGTPTIAVGTGAGAGSALINGTDAAGSILVTTGAGPAASAIVATITFRNPYQAAPEVLLVPNDAQTAALTGNAAMFVKRANTTTTKFEIWVGSTPLGQPLQFNFSFLVMQPS